MFCAAIIIAAIVAIFATAWAALIIQSLASAGKLEPYFASEIIGHFPPENDDYFILDEDFIFVDSNGKRWIARKGMQSDGASVGSLLGIPVIGMLVIWAIRGTPLTGPLRPAAFAHDGIYARAMDESFWWALVSSLRAAGDRVIFEAARCRSYRIGRFIRSRVPMATLRAFVVMALLRVAGWKAWIDDSRAARSLKEIDR